MISYMCIYIKIFVICWSFKIFFGIFTFNLRFILQYARNFLRSIQNYCLLVRIFQILVQYYRSMVLIYRHLFQMIKILTILNILIKLVFYNILDYLYYLLNGSPLRVSTNYSSYECNITQKFLLKQLYLNPGFLQALIHLRFLVLFTFFIFPSG